jgi:hypothetical protein
MTWNQCEARLCEEMGPQAPVETVELSEIVEQKSRMEPWSIQLLVVYYPMWNNLQQRLDL